MHSVDEIEDLYRCRTDLARIFELARTCTSHDAAEIAEKLLGMLLGMLNLDFVYLRLEGGSYPFLKIDPSLVSAVAPERVSDAIAEWLATEPRLRPQWVTIGTATVRATLSQLGSFLGLGVLISGSRRPSFPTQTEELRLKGAANQATIAFHEAKQLGNPPLSEHDLVDPKNKTLSETERALKLFIDIIPVTAWYSTADGMLEFFNQDHLDYVDRALEDLQGLGFLSQFHPDDLPKLLSTWQEMMTSKRGGELEGRTRRADGEYRWTLMQTTPLLDERGQVIRWYGINTDIEDRKRAEDSLKAANQALAENERNLTLIIDSLPILVWSSRADGSADYVNKHYLDYVGLPRSEIMDWGFLQVIHPDDVDRLFISWKKQLNQIKAFSQARIRRFDGEYRWFYFSGERFTDSTGNVRWFGVSLDIENLKRAEDALKESEAALQKSERRLHEIISSIPALAWSANTEGAATFINQHYLDYVGMDLSSALGSGWASTVHPDDVRHLFGELDMMKETGRGGDVEARLRRADGEYRWFLFRTNPLYDEAGRLTQWFGINIDIEDRKRAENKLRESQAELAHVMRMMTMGELAVSIAHEVNQPLMAIVTNAGTCLRWLDDRQLDISQARKAAERISRDGHRVAEIITSIRGLARKSPPAVAPMQLEHAIREILDLTRGEFQRFGIQSTIEFFGRIPEVFGDRTQIQQVILNLIMNSVEAMAHSPEQRSLTIRVSAKDDGFAHVAVADSGPGIASGIADSLFDAFFTTKREGIGMGLSICRSIVEAHGGRIWACPNKPRGSVFNFTVPLAADVTPEQKRFQ